jgi:DNA-binding transcriptional regulator GbsR (MarR family)
MALIFIQPALIQKKYQAEIELLKENLRKLQTECDDATARAEKYEEDFQKELNRISILLNKMI